MNAVYVECANKKSGACEPRSINVFEPGKTYVVFFLFAMVAESTTFSKEGRRSLSLWELAHAPPLSGSNRLGALRQIDKAEMAN